MAPRPVGQSSFGMATFGVSQNMQTQYIEHIAKLEPLIIEEMKSSPFRGSVTNQAKLDPQEREMSIVIDTNLVIAGDPVPVRL